MNEAKNIRRRLYRQPTFALPRTCRTISARRGRGRATCARPSGPRPAAGGLSAMPRRPGPPHPSRQERRCRRPPPGSDAPARRDVLGGSPRLSLLTAPGPPTRGGGPAAFAPTGAVRM